MDKLLLDKKSSLSVCNQSQGINLAPKMLISISVNALPTCSISVLRFVWHQSCPDQFFFYVSSISQQIEEHKPHTQRYCSGTLRQNLLLTKNHNCYRLSIPMKTELISIASMPTKILFNELQARSQQGMDGTLRYWSSQYPFLRIWATTKHGDWPWQRTRC